MNSAGRSPEKKMHAGREDRRQFDGRRPAWDVSGVSLASGGDNYDLWGGEELEPSPRLVEEKEESTVTPPSKQQHRRSVGVVGPGSKGARIEGEGWGRNEAERVRGRGCDRASLISCDGDGISNVACGGKGRREDHTRGASSLGVRRVAAPDGGHHASTPQEGDGDGDDEDGGEGARGGEGAVAVDTVSTTTSSGGAVSGRGRRIIDDGAERSSDLRQSYIIGEQRSIASPRRTIGTGDKSFLSAPRGARGGRAAVRGRDPVNRSRLGDVGDGDGGESGMVDAVGLEMSNVEDVRVGAVWGATAARGQAQKRWVDRDVARLLRYDGACWWLAIYAIGTARFFTMDRFARWLTK